MLLKWSVRPQKQWTIREQPNVVSTAGIVPAYSEVDYYSIRHSQPLRVRATSLWRFRDHTQGRTTVGRTPLDEWSARRRDLYLTTLTTDKHPCRRRDFFFFVLSTSSVLLHFPNRPGCATHNANIHAPGGIRNLDPSKRSAVDTRLWPLFHWDRLSLSLSLSLPPPLLCRIL
jgi:hypothetical protein